MLATLLRRASRSLGIPQFLPSRSIHLHQFLLAADPSSFDFIEQHRQQPVDVSGTRNGPRYERGHNSNAASPAVDALSRAAMSEGGHKDLRKSVRMPPWWRTLQNAANKADYKSYLSMLEAQLEEDGTSEVATFAVSRALERLPAPIALQVFNLAKTHGVVPSTFMCVSVVRLLVKLGMLRHVEGAINHMLANGLKPHWAPFFYWADAYAEAGDASSVAAVAQMAHKNGIKVSDHYHTLLVKALCKAGKRADTLRLLARLKASGITPSEPTWRALIHCHGSAGHAGQAKLIFDDMRRCGVTPSVSTWTALIHSFSECHMTQEAEAAMHAMLAAGVQPNVQTYTSLIKAHAQDADADTALQLLQEMKQKGLAPNNYTWTVVLGACAAAGNPGAARGVMDQMIQAGYHLSSKEYTTLLSAYRVSGDLEGCQAVLAEMEARKIPRNLNIYTESVMLLGEHGLPYAAMGAAAEMKDRGIQPDWLFYNVFIATLMHNWVHLEKRDPKSPLLLQAQDSFREGLFSGIIKLPRALNSNGNLLRVDLHNYGTWAAQLAVLELLKEMQDYKKQHGICRALQLVTGQGLKKRRAPMREVVLRQLRQLVPVRVSRVNEGTLVVSASSMEALMHKLIAQKKDPLTLSHVLIDPGDVVGIDSMTVYSDDDSEDPQVEVENIRMKKRV